MEYKIIKKNKGSGRHIVRDNGIGVQKFYIVFHSGFSLTYGRKRFVQFAENEDGCLCFRMVDEKSDNTYLLSTTKNGAQMLRIPTIIKNRVCQFGKYDVTQDGEWFVTECKLN